MRDAIQPRTKILLCFSLKRNDRLQGFYEYLRSQVLSHSRIHGFKIHKIIDFSEKSVVNTTEGFQASSAAGRERIDDIHAYKIVPDEAEPSIDNTMIITKSDKNGSCFLKMRFFR